MLAYLEGGFFRSRESVSREKFLRSQFELSRKDHKSLVLDGNCIFLSELIARLDFRKWDTLTCLMLSLGSAFSWNSMSHEHVMLLVICVMRVGIGGVKESDDDKISSVLFARYFVVYLLCRRWSSSLRVEGILLDFFSLLDDSSWLVQSNHSRSSRCSNRENNFGILFSRLLSDDLSSTVRLKWECLNSARAQMIKN